MLWFQFHGPSSISRSNFWLNYYASFIKLLTFSEIVPQFIFCLAPPELINVTKLKLLTETKPFADKK